MQVANKKSVKSKKGRINMTDLSTSSLDMISDFFKAFIANNSRVFLYSAKMTYKHKRIKFRFVYTESKASRNNF